MILHTNVERERFIRAVESNDIQTAQRFVSQPDLTNISQWVEMHLYLSSSVDMLNCLLDTCCVSDHGLSETLVQAARKNNLDMVENLIDRGAKDGIQSEAMAFAIVHRNKDIARLLAPVSNLMSFSIETMDPMSREFFDMVVSEHLRHKLHTEISAHTHTPKPAKKM